MNSPIGFHIDFHMKSQLWMVWSRYSGPSSNLLSNKIPKFTSVMPRLAGTYPWGTRRALKPGEARSDRGYVAAIDFQSIFNLS